MKDWDCCNRSFCFIGKGNKERRVFVPKKIDRIIDEWLMARGLEDGIFFPRICPGADKSKLLFRTMQPSSIYRILQKRAGLAELGKVRPHDLRRTFATRMLEQGCDLFILQDVYKRQRVVSSEIIFFLVFVHVFSPLRAVRPALFQNLMNGFRIRITLINPTLDCRNFIRRSGIQKF